MTVTSTEQLQRRTLRVLVGVQVLSGAGISAGITVGALLAQDMLGSTGLAGLPSALFTAGSATAAILVGRISHTRGRRPGLATGYAVGALGSAGVVTAAVLDNPVLLFVALFVYGAGSATNLQARYAGADLAGPDRRARSISTVLVATTLGGVAGPMVAEPMGHLAHHFGIPHLAGPFMLAGVAYAAAAAALARWLRPDPLLHAKTLAAVAPTPTDPATTSRPRRAELVRHGVALGTLIMVLTQVVMVAIMTMTPVHMRDHGHSTGAAGLVIAVHVAAMYLPSPVTGRLVDRIGRGRMAVAAGGTLLLAGLLASSAADDSVAILAVALGLLGLGWNFGLVAGTALVTDSLPVETRARTQGLVDVAIAIAGAGGGLMSGVVVHAAGYSVLSLAGGVVALAIIPAVAASVRPRVEA